MYKKKLHIHFIGIGGIGMSGIAQILKLQGYNVSGCDSGNKNGNIIQNLASLGCIISNTHDVSHINDADVLVYSSAINQQNPEVHAALEKGIPVIPRAIMLAEIMRTKYSIAVSGSHGKTTTTSLISHIMMEAKKDPTVIVGGILKSITSSVKLGKGNILIAEADESDRSLLYLNPTMVVVTNIDNEHLDTYQDINDIKNTFKNFIARIPFYGKAFLCIDDTNIQSILPIEHINTIKYGLSTKSDIMGNIIKLTSSQAIFDVYVNKFCIPQKQNNKNILGRVTLNIPGEHNVLNALAAICVGLEFDISFKKIASALKNFRGIERRFEHKGFFRGAEIIDDYAHHPTEIKKTLDIAQKRNKNRLFVAIEPHRYTRIEKLWDEYVELISNKTDIIHKIYIMEIYAANEKPIPNITTKKLVEAIKIKRKDINIQYTKSYIEIFDDVKNNLKKGDLFITLGAGKINSICKKLINEEENYAK